MTTDFDTFDHVTDEICRFLDGFEHPLAVGALTCVLIMLIKSADDPDALRAKVIGHLQKGMADEPPTLN